ncbi:MAG: VanZ family protein [Burkholderiales bacterium]|nr:VanZ family protein [Burkholderiales bacterium]
MAASDPAADAASQRRAWLAAGALVAAAIVWLSLTPSPPQAGVEHEDKVGHVVAYGALMYCLYRGAVSRAARLAFAAASLAMGIGLEFAQDWLGYRHREIADIVANAAGVALGWAVPGLARRRDSAPVRGR